MTGGLSRRQLLKLGALAPAAVALSGLHLPAAVASTAGPLPATVPSRKKGVGVAHPKQGDPAALTEQQCADRVTAMQPAWYYTWSPTGFDEVQDAAFVPMVWGASTTAQDQAGKIQEQVDAVRALGPGKRAVVLGPNEPDNKPPQSNMTVDEVLGYWPEISDLAALTVSPAPAHPLDTLTDQWFSEFAEKAAALGLKYDYVAVHTYPGATKSGYSRPEAAAADFLSMVDRVYDVYGRPIWVTEFALADWGAKRATASAPAQLSRYTAGDALTFMQLVLPELERRPHVARYAWFGAGPLAATSTALPQSALFDQEGNVTELGQFYAAFGAGASGASASPVQAGGAGRRYTS